MSWKKHVQFRTSLTRNRQNLLTFARNLCTGAEEINFIFSDINDNLKIRLKEPIGYRQVYSFWNKLELAEILAKLDLDGYQLADHDFDEFWEGISPTKWVILSARTIRISLIYYLLAQNHLSNMLPLSWYIFAMSAFVSRNTK